MILFAHSETGHGWGSFFEPWEIHPALNHLPIAFLLGGVGLDLYAWARGRTDLARLATGLLILGLVTGFVTALAGVLAFFTVPAHTEEAHRLMYWHIGIQAGALILFALPSWERWRHRATAPTLTARLVGCLAGSLLMIGSGIGGYLVYHGGAGVEPQLLAEEVRGGHSHSNNGAKPSEGHSHSDSNTKQAEPSDGHSHPDKDPKQAKPSEGHSHPDKDPKQAEPSDGHSHPDKSAKPAEASEGHSHPDKSAKTEGQSSPDKTAKQSESRPLHESHYRGPDAAEEPRAPSKAQPAPAARAPEDLPRVPPADAKAAQVPAGYRVEVVLADLTYPTSIAFDDSGTMYIAEGGFNYGDDVAPARVLRVSKNGKAETVVDHLNGPVTDLLWHDKRLYISHRGKISALEGGRLRDLVTGLPSLGDHHNNQLAVGPDGKIYFGQGTATNSGVVGLDSFKMGWLARYPEVRDIPAKDIRLQGQAFETPDPLALLADKPKGKAAGHDHGGPAKGKPGDGHDAHGDQAPKKSEQAPGGASKGHEGHDQKDMPPKDKPAVDLAELNRKALMSRPARQDSKGTSDKPAGHEGHDNSDAKGKDTKPAGGPGSDTPKSKDKPPGGHEGHEKQAPKGTADKPAGGHEGHDSPASKNKGDKSADGHAGHDQSASNQSAGGHQMVKTYPFQPFGKTPPDAGAVRGTIKASGTILRMDPDGSNLEIYAWGLRNPFGVRWSPDGKLYATDNGYDERGSRPIAHAPDLLWVIKKDAWYGFPDYAGGVPVTDAKFRPENGPAPKFLMRDHPPVEKPFVTFKNHVAAAKLDFSRSDAFGFKGDLFVALAGDMNPITGEHAERSGFEVVRIDPNSGKVETFFKARSDALGPKGMEYVVTAGPRRPVDARFSPKGDALYVVDVGALAVLPTAAGPAPRPFPGTGVVWRITREAGGR